MDKSATAQSAPWRDREEERSGGMSLARMFGLDLDR
jgi:hypothetical protein